MFGTSIPTEVPCSVSLPAMEHTPSTGPTGMQGQMHRVRERVRLQGKAVGRAGRRSARETSVTLGASRPRPADGQMARVAGIPSWGPSPHTQTVKTHWPGWSDPPSSLQSSVATCGSRPAELEDGLQGKHRKLRQLSPAHIRTSRRPNLCPCMPRSTRLPQDLLGCTGKGPRPDASGPRESTAAGKSRGQSWKTVCKGNIRNSRSITATPCRWTDGKGRWDPFLGS